MSCSSKVSKSDAVFTQNKTILTCFGHFRSSSAILDLEYNTNTSLESQNAKRRSLSTCGDSSKNPQSKIEMDWTSPEKLSVQPSQSFRTKSSPGHVRFEVDTPTKCHHLLSDATPSSATPQYPPQIVQRTQSNPEMELCPVCLARKECEILLKRTYSKVFSRVFQTPCYHCQHCYFCFALQI